MDGEWRKLNGLAVRVCKICARPFAFSFAFIPVREPNSATMGQDQTRQSMPIADKAYDQTRHRRTISIAPPLIHEPMEAVMIWTTALKLASGALHALSLLAISAVGVSLIVVGGSSAQTYPGKLIKFVVPLAAGSQIDVMARLTAPALSARLGQPIIIENRPGGGATIGAKHVAMAPPDGYTLLFVGASHTLGPALIKNLDYDPVKDFAPIATVGMGSWVLVVAQSVPARSLKELVAYANANPGTLNWGFGLNAGPHLLGELFLLATGIDVNKIPYKSGVQALPDMLGGRIQMNFGSTENVVPLIREGKLRALAVTSDRRSPDLPDVPTMIESGYPRLTRGYWTGLLAPVGTPADIVNRLNAEINASLATPNMRASLTKVGVEPKAVSPQEFASLIVDEIEDWKTAAKAAGIAPE
jgi:tripartite-type tricarboxylate transporter receptor subunit TctC